MPSLHAVASAATHDRGNHETRTDSPEVLIREAHRLLAERRLAVKPSKVAKLACPPETPRPLRNHWGIILDSTGETAVRRVTGGAHRAAIA